MVALADSFRSSTPVTPETHTPAVFVYVSSPLRGGRMGVLTTALRKALPLIQSLAEPRDVE